jgi:hypothetical protein
MVPLLIFHQKCPKFSIFYIKNRNFLSIFSLKGLFSKEFRGCDAVFLAKMSRIQQTKIFLKNVEGDTKIFFQVGPPEIFFWVRH